MTIYELSKRLGFSVSTVSKALNGAEDVSEETRKLIREKAKELGYVLNLAARSITTKRSYLIGVLFHEATGDGFMNPHFMEILQSFKQEAAAHGYSLLFVDEDETKSERTLLQTCLYRGIDGVWIVAADNTRPEVEELLESKIPCVTTDFAWEGQSSVLPENEEGMQQAVEYLLDLGHREILYVSMDCRAHSARERLKGVRAAFQGRGLTIPAERIIDTHSFSFSGGYEAMKRLLPELDGITAIAFSNDQIAFGAIHALREAGKSIPGDISVIGFDNAELQHIPVWNLTTMGQPRKQIGLRAAQALIERMNNSSVPGRIDRLPVALIERTSCRKL